jgi:NAD(P)-dependent dehydrogenase (short-subunit alcohol dehydrogenase family)
VLSSLMLIVGRVQVHALPLESKVRTSVPALEQLLTECVGMAGFSPYVMSKFAVRGLTQSAGARRSPATSYAIVTDTRYSIALEFGKHGITVNAYAPGSIQTPARTTLYKPK